MLARAGLALAGLALAGCRGEADQVLEPPPEPIAPHTDAATTSDPVPGFADLHNHQFAEYAYQGAWYHGTTLGPEEGDDEWAGMSACDGNARGGPQDHAMTYMNLLCEVAGATTDDMCVHTDRKNGYHDPGYPYNYDGWPHSTSWAHQQTWWGHLKQAHEDGLNLTVVHAVSFKILCQVMEPSNYRYDYGCEDMGAIDLEIAAAKDFVEQESDWIEIAYSPADARRIIQEGKLAMVLAVEITDIFSTGAMDYAPMQVDADGKILDRGGVLTQLQYYYDLGVRSIQLGHELDSRFAGVAVYSPIFAILAAIEDFQEAHPGGLVDVKLPGTRENNYGFDLDENGYNRMGLTDEGRQLLEAMMDLGMIVDIAHMSDKSEGDIYEIAKQHDYYPLFNSHTKFEQIMVLPDEDDLEKYSTDAVIDRINATGGMVGMRTIGDRVNTWPESGVANNCDGSTRSFAQAYGYGDKELRVHMGFGIDLNGFANQTNPRFGQAACDQAPDQATQLEQQGQQTDPGTGTDYDRYGLGHVGLLGRGLLQDLKNVGADTGNLEASAENFIALWERSLDPDRTGPVGPPPVAADSQLHKKSEGAGGLVIESIHGEAAAVPGNYTFTASGSSAAREVQLYLNGTPIARTTYDEGSRVTAERWATLEFGNYLTLKIGSSSDSGSDLTQLDDAFFDGVQTLTLAYP